MDHVFSAISHVWWGVVIVIAAIQIHNGLVALGNAILGAAKLHVPKNAKE